MKVLVLNPPVFDRKYTREGRCQSEGDTWLVNFPPATLACVAGQVRTKYETRLMDCIGADIGFDEAIAEIVRFHPDAVIMDTSTPTINGDLRVAEEIKKRTGAKMIMYGEHVTANYANILKHHQIDFCIRGEPETPAMNILAENPKVPGVAFGDFVGDTWQEPNLDDLAIPAYDLMPSYFYPLTHERWMFVRSGRGCPFNCHYCIVPMMSKRKARYHSPEYMIKQFKWLANDLSIKKWMLWDELSTLNKARMMKMCELIQQEKLEDSCRWFCTNRVDMMDEDLAKAMSAAGCMMMAFGLESGSDEVLKENEKGGLATTDKARKTIALCKKYGISTVGHFIVGLPGSSPERDMQTVAFAKEIGVDFAQFYVATPFPGSELYQIAKDNQWLTTDDWSKVEQGDIAISYPNYSSEQILETRRKAYKEFYFRPVAVLRGLSAMGPRGWVRLPTYAKTFLGWMAR